MAHLAAMSAKLLFQSAPPARGATDRLPVSEHRDERFNPRPPREGRRSLQWARPGAGGCFDPRPPREGRRDQHRRLADQHAVSIRAPRARGGWHVSSTGCALEAEFQSAPPARGSDRRLDHSQQAVLEVSIRAPRARGRPADLRPGDGRRGVSIRAPRARGDGDRRRSQWLTEKMFQIRSPPREGGDPAPLGEELP